MGNLREYVILLENKSSSERRDIIKKFLKKEKIPFKVQKFTSHFKKGENIIVDLDPKKSNEKRVLLTAHYDVAGKAYGANDNASGVAVLLSLLKKFKRKNIKKKVRIIFFDLEEYFLLLPGFDTNGSRAYLKEYGVQDIDHIINLEMVGIGDKFILWPIKKEQEKYGFLKNIVRKLKIKKYDFLIVADPPPVMHSDHLPFVQMKFKKIVSITMIHSNEKEFFKIINKKQWWKFFKEFIKFSITKKSDVLPRILKHYHTKEDSSEFIEESCLNKVYTVLLDVINN